jgi:ABC-2 type transport system ATP-binding protein
MKQKVLIISSLIHNPEIILWDEPLSGVDFNTNILIRDIVKELTSRGRTILYSTHILDMVDKICNKVIIIDKGKIVYDSHYEAAGMTIEKILQKYVDVSGSKEKAAEIYKKIIT